MASFFITFTFLGLVSYASAACNKAELQKCVANVGGVLDYKTKPDSSFDQHCTKVMTAFKCLTTGGYFVCDTPSETEPAVSTVFQRSVCLYKKYHVLYNSCLFARYDDNKNHQTCVDNAKISGNYLKSSCQQRVLYATCLFEATSQQCGTLAASYRLRLFDVAQKAMSWTDICSLGGVDTTSFRNVKPTTPNALGQCMCIGHFPDVSKAYQEDTSFFEKECKKVSSAQECMEKSNDTCKLFKSNLDVTQKVCKNIKYHKKYVKCAFNASVLQEVTNCGPPQLALTDCNVRNAIYKCAQSILKTQCDAKTASYFMWFTNVFMTYGSPNAKACPDPKDVNIDLFLNDKPPSPSISSHTSPGSTKKLTTSVSGPSTTEKIGDVNDAGIQSTSRFALLLIIVCKVCFH